MNTEIPMAFLNSEYSINTEEYGWLQLAVDTAFRNSECCRRQVGVVAVEYRDLSTRETYVNHLVDWNAPPDGIKTCKELGECPLRYDETGSHCYNTLHAEAKLILQERTTKYIDWSNCRIYITSKPCLNCAMMLYSLGVRAVIYLTENPNLPEKQARVVVPEMKFIPANIKKVSLPIGARI